MKLITIPVKYRFFKILCYLVDNIPTWIYYILITCCCIGYIGLICFLHYITFFTNESSADRICCFIVTIIIFYIPLIVALFLLLRNYVDNNRYNIRMQYNDYILKQNEEKVKNENQSKEVYS